MQKTLKACYGYNDQEKKIQLIIFFVADQNDK